MCQHTYDNIILHIPLYNASYDTTSIRSTCTCVPLYQFSMFYLLHHCTIICDHISSLHMRIQFHLLHHYIVSDDSSTAYRVLPYPYHIQLHLHPIVADVLINRFLHHRQHMHRFAHHLPLYSHHYHHPTVSRHVVSSFIVMSARATSLSSLSQFRIL